MKNVMIILILTTFLCSTVVVAIAANGGGISLIEKPCTKGTCALRAYQ